MNTNVETMTDNELKAIAYDSLAVIEQSKQNLQIVQTELSKRLNPVTDETEAKAPTKAKGKVN